LSRKFAIFAIFALFATMWTAAVAKAAGPSGPMTLSIDLPFYVHGPNVLLDIKVGKSKPGWMGGGSVLLVPCKVGQQRLDMIHRTRHLANGESLRPYKFGPGWVYQFPASTGQAGKRFELKIPIKLLFGKTGSGFQMCVDAHGYNYASEQYVYAGAGFGVK
jgi:hypothetical protein